MHSCDAGFIVGSGRLPRRLLKTAWEAMEGATEKTTKVQWNSQEVTGARGTESDEQNQRNRGAMWATAKKGHGKGVQFTILFLDVRDRIRG